MDVANHLHARYLFPGKFGIGVFQSAMYVCICNAVRECEVRQAIDSGGAGTAAQVYRCLGVSPQCGRCAETIREILTEGAGVTA